MGYGSTAGSARQVRGLMVRSTRPLHQGSMRRTEANSSSASFASCQRRTFRLN